MGDKLAPSKRHQVVYQDRVAYEWDQTLSEVNIYIQTPQGVDAKQVQCDIKSQSLCVGLKDKPPYMDVTLHKPVKVDDSYWTLMDGMLTIALEKLVEEQVWPGVDVGHELGTDSQQEDQKRLLLERFQQQHGGFDFSQADIQGNVPDPSTFLKDIQQ